MCAWYTYVRPISSTRKRMHVTLTLHKLKILRSSEKATREPTGKLNSKNRSYKVTRVVGKIS